MDLHQPIVTASNRGPLVNVLAWFLVIVSCLTTSTRIATKWLVSQTISLDDGMIIISLVRKITEEDSIAHLEIFRLSASVKQ